MLSQKEMQQWDYKPTNRDDKKKNFFTRIAIPVDKFYSKFLCNGIIKFPTPSGECSYSDYLLACEKQGKSRLNGVLIAVI